MARPAKDDAQRRSYHLSVRLTNAERSRLEKAAATAGLGVGDYVRLQVLGRALVVHALHPLPKHALKELRQLGITLNQVTRTANGTHRLPRDLSALANRLTGFLDRQIDSGEGLDRPAVDQLRRIAVNGAQLARIAADDNRPVPVALATLRKRLDRLLTEAGVYGA